MSVAELTYDAQLKLLFRATVNPDEFRFILIQYNHYSLVEEVFQALKAKYPDRAMLRLKIGEENYDSLIQKLTTHQGLVFIEDFNRLLDDPDLYVGFNQRRDRISRLPVQLVCFLPEGPRYIRDCMEKLRDWWSIRNLVLHLRTEVSSEEKHTLEARQEVSSLGGYTANEKKEELQRLLSRISELQSTGEASELLDNLYSQALQILKDLGWYRQGLELAEKWLSKARQGRKSEVELAKVYSWLGIFFQYLGHYQRAKEFQKKALEIFEKNFGPDHPNTAVTYSNLALGLQDLAEYQRAKGLLEKAMASAEKNFGPDHPTTAVSYNNLAAVLQDLGDYQGAKVLLEKAIKSAEKNFGPDHPTTARSYSSLASVLQALGDYERAKVLLEKALESNEKNFGPEHPNTAWTYNNLAGVLMDMKEYGEARRLLEKAKTVFLSKLGAEHPDSKNVLRGLARLDELEGKGGK